MAPRLPRFEWISLIYLAFFALAILSPSMVRHAVLGLPEEQAEEALIFLFGSAGLICFSWLERWMEKKEEERQIAVTDLEKTRRELASSYEYIGSINRRIDALKKLTNETVGAIGDSERQERELFRSIIAGAAAHVRIQRGGIRFLSLQKLRTIKEYTIDSDQAIRVPNRDLLEVHTLKKSHAFIHDENGSDVLIIPSSRNGNESKAFLLLPMSSSTLADIDPDMLRVYADQAEVLYRLLANKAAAVQVPSLDQAEAHESIVDSR